MRPPDFRYSQTPRRLPKRVRCRFTATKVRDPDRRQTTCRWSPLQFVTMTTETLPRRLALSPSRASDFKQCPLKYRLRAVDKLPEAPTKAAFRGTVVHAALESLYGLPAAERMHDAALGLVEPSWKRLTDESPALAELIAPDDLETFLTEAKSLVTAYYELEDPTRFSPAAVRTVRRARTRGRCTSARLHRSPRRRADRPGSGGRLQDRPVTERVVRSQGSVPDEVLRARGLPNPRRGADATRTAVPRRRQTAGLPPRRSRTPALRKDALARSGRQFSSPARRATSAQIPENCAAGAISRRIARRSAARCPIIPAGPRF